MENVEEKKVLIECHILGPQKVSQNNACKIHFTSASSSWAESGDIQ